MAKLTLVLLTALIVLASAERGNAALHYQSALDLRCYPAQPGRIEVSKWKPFNTCTNDCFRFTLLCSDNRALTLLSPVHPQTSELQFLFYTWASWSIAAVLLPLVAFIGMAIAGSQFHAGVIALNALFLAYATGGALYYYGSVTGNPLAREMAMAALLYPNPIIVALMIVIFVVVNFGPVGLCLRALVGKPVWPMAVDDPAEIAAAMTDALTPGEYSPRSARKMTRYYRREMERARALKSQLEARTKSAKAHLKAMREQGKAPDEA